MKMLKIYIAMLTALNSAVAFSQAAENKASSSNKTFEEAISELTDTLVDIPAASVLLGSDTSKIVNATSFRALGASLGQGFDEKGKLKSGLGVQLYPLLLFKAVDPMSKSYAGRALARTSVSLATGVGSDARQDIAYGLNTVLWLPALDSVNTKSLKCLDDIPTGMTNEAYKAAVKECNLKFDKLVSRLENSSILSAGVGSKVDKSSGTSSKSSSVAWLTGRWNFHENVENPSTQIIATGHLRHTSNGLAPDPTGGTSPLGLKSNLASVAVKAERPWGTTFLEYSQEQRDYVSIPSESRRRVLFGSEFKIAADLTMQISVGREKGRLYGKADPVVAAGFRWAISPVISKEKKDAVSK